MGKLTPMMQQYQSIKKNYQDAIVFFRMGDFYEMFGEDAKEVVQVLDIALTSRNKGGGEETPMAGVPAHSAEQYIATLIENDYKVAICEQLEDPDETSGLVERGVIRVITPGTVIENEILEDKENNYLAALMKTNEKIGFSYLDISTGEFYATEFSQKNAGQAWDEIDRIKPREIIIEDKYKENKIYKQLRQQYNFVENSPRVQDVKESYNKLCKHFKTNSLAGFGCENRKAAILAAGEALAFIQETQKRALVHINNLSTYSLGEYMNLDSATRRNLELTSTLRDNKRSGTLLNIIDQTITSMGGRMIKRWVNQPLINKKEIDRRLEAVTELSGNYMLLQRLREDLQGIYDLERILGKITYESANARDLASLKFSLNKLPGLENDCSELNSSLMENLTGSFDPLKDLYDLLDSAILDDPPVTVREGGLIKKGYSKELDELRETCSEGKDWITNLQKRERERTGIGSLKVGYNKIFGYYIEVTNPNLDQVPEDYTRKQTLSNSERYIIPELKEKEAQVLGAEEKINELEYNLFVEVRNKIGENIARIKNTAQIISQIDVLLSLALVAIENNYCRPSIKEGQDIKITDGRHPVVEEMLDDVFVPNDTELNQKDKRFVIITGPNMSGKSTYMRQVALIVLLAQMGSFVPAEEAEIGIVDRIFTRVGASDDLTTGQSTFMVEMNEVANIVNNATQNSLVILDEVGRGTSTYDGVSIAWAVSKYINDPDKIGARTLFATHYHELTRLEESTPGIINYNVLVEEDKKGVHFLHKIVPGRADDSYGIEVARLAGLPQELIINAQRILNHLEKNNQQDLDTETDRLTATSMDKEKQDETHSVREQSQQSRKEVASAHEERNINETKQLRLFNPENSIIEKVRELDLMNTTPMEAMNFLSKLQREIKEGETDNE
ncbi:MAG: DNA mismatch repair protein MutS [Halanaerobiales bacterium]